MIRYFFIAVFSLSLLSDVLAQTGNVFLTPTPGETTTIILEGCLNSAVPPQVVPMNGGTCANGGVPVTITNTPSVNVANTPGVTVNNSPTVQPGNTQNTTPWLTSQASSPTGGATSLTPFITTSSTNATLVAAGQHNLYDVQVIQTTTTLGDLRLYDINGTPNCASTTGLVRNWPIQSNAISPGVGFSFPGGMNFANGITFCFTGANSNTDNSNGPAGVTINMGYK